jgi:hypothetical protein
MKMRVIMSFKVAGRAIRSPGIRLLGGGINGDGASERDLQVR